MTALSLMSTAAANTAPAAYDRRTTASQSATSTNTIATPSAKIRPPSSGSVGATAISAAASSPPTQPERRRPSRYANTTPTAAMVTIPSRTPVTETPYTQPIACRTR